LPVQSAKSQQHLLTPNNASLLNAQQRRATRSRKLTNIVSSSLKWPPRMN